MLHCLSANDYGQPERSRKFHSPLHPDIMDLDKKLTTKDNQWLLKVSYCGTFQPSGMGAALIRMVIWDQYPPTTPSLSESFSAVLLSVSDFFVQKYLVQYQLLLWRSLQIRHYLSNKETKVQLRINEHEDAFKHIRWTSSITVFSFSSLFFWQAITSVQSWSLRHVTITIYSHLMYNYYAIHHSFILF